MTLDYLFINDIKCDTFLNWSGTLSKTSHSSAALFSCIFGWFFQMWLAKNKLMIIPYRKVYFLSKSLFFHTIISHFLETLRRRSQSPPAATVQRSSSACYLCVSGHLVFLHGHPGFVKSVIDLLACIHRLSLGLTSHAKDVVRL